MKIGEVVRRRRKELGLTQGQVARQVGFDVANISRFERGEQGIDQVHLKPLARALNTTVAELYSQTEEYKKSSLSDLSVLKGIVSRIQKIEHVFMQADEDGKLELIKMFYEDEINK